MKQSTLLLLVAIFALLGVVVYNNFIKGAMYVQSSSSPNMHTTSSHEKTTNTHSSSKSLSDLPIRPSIVAIFGYSKDCLYCSVVREHLNNKVILKELDVDNPTDKTILLSELNRRHLEYVGVPTVIIGSYAFVYYQDSDVCPSQTTEVTVKVGKGTIKLCRLKDYPNYYIYMPSKVDQLIGLCNKYKDSTCYS